MAGNFSAQELVSHRDQWGIVATDDYIRCGEVFSEELFTVNPSNSSFRIVFVSGKIAYKLLRFFDHHLRTAIGHVERKLSSVHGLLNQFKAVAIRPGPCKDSLLVVSKRYQAPTRCYATPSNLSSSRICILGLVKDNQWVGSEPGIIVKRSQQHIIEINFSVTSLQGFAINLLSILDQSLQQPVISIAGQIIRQIIPIHQLEPGLLAFHWNYHSKGALLCHAYQLDQESGIFVHHIRLATKVSDRKVPKLVGVKLHTVRSISPSCKSNTVHCANFDSLVQLGRFNL